MDVRIEFDLDAKGNLYARVPNQPGITQAMAERACRQVQRELQLDQEIPIKMMSEPEAHVHPEHDRIAHTGRTHAH